MTTDDEPITVVTQDEAIDALGRRAGAELRHSAPPNSLESTIHRARTRTNVRNGLFAGAAVVLTVVAIAVLAGQNDREPSSPVAPATTTAPPAPSTAPPLQVSAYDGTLAPIVFSTGDHTSSGRLPLLTVDADGSDAQLVRELWGGLSVSPGGTSLLENRQTPDGQHLWPVIVDADGLNEHFVASDDPALDLGATDWAPDGTRIVGEGVNGDDPTRSGVYTVGVDGSDLRQLTQPSPRRDFPVGDEAYSPTGDRILFYRTVEGFGDPYQRVQLMVMNTDGTDVVQLSPPEYQAGAFGTVSWSPDGSQVAFVAADGDGAFIDSTFRALFIVNADGTGLTQVTDWKNILAVDWSPDGTQFAVMMIGESGDQRGGDFEIFTMRTDGSDVVQLTFPHGESSYSAGPTWSPDGTTLMYEHGEGSPQRFSVQLIDVATGESRVLLPPSEIGYTAGWVPS